MTNIIALNQNLEELSMSFMDDISFTGILGLKSMQKLKCLNLRIYQNEKNEEIDNLREQLPQMSIVTIIEN